MVVTRALLTSIAVMFGSVPAAQADSPPPSWQGTFFITSVSSGCTSSGESVGEYGTVLYRPIINAGDAAEGISLFFPRSALTIISKAASGSFKGNTAYSAFETGHRVTPYQFNGSSNLSITPTNVSSNTQQILISGTINNYFDDRPECNVVIKALLLPRL